MATRKPTRNGIASMPLSTMRTSLAGAPAPAVPVSAVIEPAPAPAAPCVCDCLNFCGDDPWLNNGRSKPCQAFVKREAERAARAAHVASVSRLVRDLVAMADECGTAVISAEDMRAIAALLPAT